MFSVNKTRRKILMTLLSLITILLVLLYYYPNNIDEDIIVPKIIEERIISLGELTTLKYHYKNTLLYKDSKELSGIEIPFTTKSFLISYEGYLKAGVDLENIIINLSDNKNITLTLFSSDFIDNVINEEDVLIYDERSSLFNKLKLENIFVILEQEKKKTEAQLREKGFLKEADEKAKTLLTNLLMELGFETITIHFKSR